MTALPGRKRLRTLELRAAGAPPRAQPGAAKGRRGGEGSRRATGEGLRQPPAVATEAEKGAARQLPPVSHGVPAPQPRLRPPSPLRGYRARRETWPTPRPPALCCCPARRHLSAPAPAATSGVRRPNPTGWETRAASRPSSAGDQESGDTARLWVPRPGGLEAWSD